MATRTFNITSVTHTEFLVDSTALEEHWGHLILFNASVSGVKLPCRILPSSIVTPRIPSLYQASQNDKDVKLCLELSQSQLSKGLLTLTLSAHAQAYL